MIKFKYEKLEYEFYKIDNRLQGIIFFIAGYINNKWNQDITLTHLLRTQAEQDEIYKTTEGYKASPWISVHQVGRGADVSTTEIIRHRIDELVSVINNLYYYSEKYNTALYHDIGLGAHIHLQVPDKAGRQHFL